MNFEKFLTDVTHRSETIIQWLFFAILLLSGVLIARSLFAKKSEGPAAEADLHTALEKILSQTAKLEGVAIGAASAPTTVAGTGTSFDQAAQAKEVQALKAELAARDEELTKLKSAGVSSPASEELAARIKELEAKLSEYEILEDDIADLSLYKEENARLKAEVEGLKNGNVIVTSPDGATTMASGSAADTAVSAPSGSDIVAEFAEVVSQAPEDTSASGSKVVVVDTGDPMADFESTVQMEKNLSAETPAPVAAAEPAAATSDAQTEADDLFAEFSQSAPPEPESEREPESEAAAAAQLDTEKMMAEMAALVSMEPTAGNALEESIDTDKMAAEATTLPKS